MTYSELPVHYLSFNITRQESYNIEIFQSFRYHVDDSIPVKFMTIDAGSNFTVTLEQSPEAGTSWQVRVYRKRFWFKKTVSSDWFLDESQAKRYAEQLAQSLRKNGLSPDYLKQREPGWTLNRPSH